MAICQNIRSKRRKVCIGDLDRVITLENRSIQPPTDATDYTILFTDETAGGQLPSAEIFALIETVTGEEIFDGHNIGTPITHHIYIPYIEGVTPETWVKLENGERLDIADVENLDERNEFYKLRCTLTGDQSKSNNSI